MRSEFRSLPRGQIFVVRPDGIKYVKTSFATAVYFDCNNTRQVVRFFSFERVIPIN